MPELPDLTYDEVVRATERLGARVRPVTVTPPDPAARPGAGVTSDGGEESGGGVWLALEFLQHTGSFKARGALNFLSAAVAAGTVPEAGVTIASGGNAGLACAWAARQLGVPATVFVPETAPAVKVARLRGYGADVRLAGREYAEAAEACAKFTAASGALASHAYDHPLIAAGAGTIVGELLARVPGLDTVVVAAGGGGLFAGVATAARHHGLRAVFVEPRGCATLHAALRAGRLVDVPVDSVAVDSLGARRATALALDAARHDLVSGVLVDDEDIIRTRRLLWDDRRLAVEHAAATALAGVARTASSGYTPDPSETVAVVLSGANTDPGDLARTGTAD